VTDFAVTGKKRSGKGLFCVGMIRDALAQGRRVATNMDIYPDKLFSPWAKVDLIRLPDVPTVEDMIQLGKGYPGDAIREDFNGLIVLDGVEDGTQATVPDELVRTPSVAKHFGRWFGTVGVVAGVPVLSDVHVEPVLTPVPEHEIGCGVSTYGPPDDEQDPVVTVTRQPLWHMLVGAVYAPPVAPII